MTAKYPTNGRRSARAKLAAQKEQAERAYAGKLAFDVAAVIESTVAATTEFGSVDPLAGFNRFLQSFQTHTMKKFTLERNGETWGLVITFDVFKLKDKPQ